MPVETKTQFGEAVKPGSGSDLTDAATVAENLEKFRAQVQAKAVSGSIANVHRPFMGIFR